MWIPDLACFFHPEIYIKNFKFQQILVKQAAYICGEVRDDLNRSVWNLYGARAAYHTAVVFGRNSSVRPLPLWCSIWLENNQPSLVQVRGLLPDSYREDAWSQWVVLNRSWADADQQRKDHIYIDPFGVWTQLQLIYKVYGVLQEL